MTTQPVSPSYRQASGGRGSPAVRSMTSHQRLTSSRVLGSINSRLMPCIREMDRGPPEAVWKPVIM